MGLFATKDITVKKGDQLYRNWQITLDGIAQDLSNYNYAVLQVRETELSDSVLTIYSSGTTYNKIDISNLEAGQIIITCPVSSSISPSTYYYDLELRNTNNNICETIVSGRFSVVADFAR
jgi:hypothetical protein